MEVGGGKVAVGKEERKRGCIKSTKGPWIVRRRGQDGTVISTSLRRPSEPERERNKLRERWRRRVAARIYAGLREHGNYRLPKHADQNDVLRALCEEAGWRVDDEGNVSRKDYLGAPRIRPTNSASTINHDCLPSNCHEEESMENDEDELSLNLTLSFKYM